MSMKISREGAKVAKRKCRRCGCTENRACLEGCSWALDTDICTACLTDTENVMLMLAAFLRVDAESFYRRTLSRAESVENFVRSLLLKEKKGGGR